MDLKQVLKRESFLVRGEDFRQGFRGTVTPVFFQEVVVEAVEFCLHSFPISAFRCLDGVYQSQRKEKSYCVLYY